MELGPSPMSGNWCCRGWKMGLVRYLDTDCTKVKAIAMRTFDFAFRMADGAELARPPYPHAPILMHPFTHTSAPDSLGKKKCLRGAKAFL
jgi:hypothetical protein